MHKDARDTGLRNDERLNTNGANTDSLSCRHEGFQVGEDGGSVYSAQLGLGCIGLKMVLAP
jgi:hypothetical protein